MDVVFDKCSVEFYAFSREKVFARLKNECFCVARRLLSSRLEIMGKLLRKVWMGRTASKNLVLVPTLAQIDTAPDVNLIPLAMAEAAHLDHEDWGWDHIYLGGMTLMIGKKGKARIRTEDCEAITSVFIPMGVLPRGKGLDVHKSLAEQASDPPTLFLLGHPFLQATRAQLDFSNDTIGCAVPSNSPKRKVSKKTSAEARPAKKK